MNVISGLVRGYKLFSAKCEKIKPTENRIKEALFSIIQFIVQDKIVLDLFSGSGQLAIEALSRGAKFCWCVDILKIACETQKQNLIKTNFINKSKIIKSDALKFLNKTDEQFDLIFLDPPYKSNLLIPVLEIVSKNLKKNGLIACEHESSLILPTNFDNIKLQKQRTYGKISLTFYHSMN